MVKKILILTTILFLVFSAFRMRVDIFIKSMQASIDEVVYYSMGKQVSRDWTDYNTIPYGHYLKSEGRELPAYFFHPLYKHPPLFTFLVALSIKIFGARPLSAIYVSLLFGVLMIPLVYLMGSLIYSRTLGIIAAFLVYLDPVSIMSSQKIWPDTVLAFFMVLSIYLFLYGLKNNKDNFYILSGISVGLAVLTKYNGILSLFGIWLYAVIFRQDLLRKKKFLMTLIIPFLMLLPWFSWTYAVYGPSFIVKQANIHNFSITSWRTLLYLAAFGYLLICSKLFFNLSRESISINEAFSESKILPYVKIILLMVIIFFIREKLVHAVQLFHIPKTSWGSHIFRFGENRCFYFGKLIEYSPLYIFAYLSFWIPNKNKNQYVPVVKIYAIFIIVFFTIWGSYQSRYVLGAIPILCIVGCDQLYQLAKNWGSYSKKHLRVLGILTICFYVFLIIWKLYYVNINLSFTNDMCYY